MKDNINQNQKNILQLTIDLKETQEELMEMRGKTKDLYDVLAFFREAAQRRLDAEFQPQPNLPQNNQIINWVSQAIEEKTVHLLWYLKMWDQEMQSLFKMLMGHPNSFNHYQEDTSLLKVVDGMR